jgi:hypothetical protein
MKRPVNRLLTSHYLLTSHKNFSDAIDHSVEIAMLNKITALSTQQDGKGAYIREAPPSYLR